MRSPWRTIDAPSASVIHTSGEYGACRSSDAYSSSCRDQVALEHRLLRRREQRERDQVHRRDAGRAVDVRHDARGQVVDRRRQPRRPLVLLRLTARTVGRVPCEHVLETHRLAEAHVHLAEALAQRRQRAQHARTPIPSPSACRTARRCRSCLRPAARSRSTPAGTRPDGADRAGSCAGSSTACRSSAAAGARCGCARLR